MNNSGEWRGYFIYAKTTGSKFYFQVNFAFKREGSNRIFSAQGKDESGDFSFQHGIIIGTLFLTSKKILTSFWCRYNLVKNCVSGLFDSLVSKVRASSSEIYL